MDSTKPASRSTRRCFDTVGCGIRSWRSISPTDCSDETRRLNIARRFGSAMISNTDSILLIYSIEHILVKAYTVGCMESSIAVNGLGTHEAFPDKFRTEIELYAYDSAARIILFCPHYEAIAML